MGVTETGESPPSGPLERFPDLIRAFYEHREVPCVSETYLILDTGGYNTYAFRSEAQAIEWLASRIGANDWKSRLGGGVLEVLSTVPELLPLVPGIRSQTLTAAAEDPFDIAVIGDRITLLELNRRLVCTIAIDDPAKLRREIERRKRLPDSINTPPMIDHDTEYPYMVKAYLDGRELVDPITEWELLLTALEQLTALYEIDRRRIETVAAVRSLEEELMAGDELDGTVRTALELLDELELPPALHRGLVHGDLHAGNVFVSDAVYLLDWEDVRTDYLIDDFFRPFVIHQYDASLHRLFAEMIDGRGGGGRILADYARRIGPITYGESTPYSGLPLFYLLRLLADVGAHGSLRPPCRELLRDVVSEYR
ncbi:phosphotransferase [Halalkalicoccus sp. GCM10025322]|uniref:phosphotransferase n=1 Tax=Halalkalicoccus TaxID=332246 RepID=UPI002F961728